MLFSILLIKNTFMTSLLLFIWPCAINAVEILNTVLHVNFKSISTLYKAPLCENNVLFYPNFNQI